MKKLGFLSLLVLLIFSSCRKDTDMVTVTEEMPNPEIIEAYQPLIQIINGDIIGQVVDFEGAPVSDATVKMGDNNTSTDIYGHFFFNDVDMNSKGQYVTIEKEGYFLGSRRFFPQADAKSRVRVEMIEKSFNQSFNTDAPETVSFGNVDIDFPATGIVNENGDTYNGDVFVAAKWLDPTTNRVYEQMPGNLQGVNTTSEEVALKTLGMVAVELQGENGEKLNIKEGSAASFRYTIPAELVENAPAEILLWSFNEEVGIWVEDGSAELSPGGDAYRGEFTHFSFWNWDIPAGNVYFSATFEDQDGNPLQNVLVTLTSSNYGSGYGYTDDQGYVSGIIPAGDVLTMEVWAAFGCASSFYTAEIGPFEEDVDLATIVLEDTSVNATSVTGTLINCDGNLTSGVIIYNLDGYQWYNYTEDGNFSFYLNNCTEFDLAYLTGYDFEGGFSSDPVELVSNTDNQVGSVSACENDISENVLTVSSSEGTWEYPVIANNSPDGLFVSVIETDSIEIAFWINPDDLAVGTIQNGGFIQAFANYNPNPDWSYFLQNQNPTGSASFDVLEITELNDFVTGNYSLMMYTDPNGGGEILVEGTFNALLQ
jgi:hypothetical protein